jgi:hypothetical protein
LAVVGRSTLSIAVTLADRWESHREKAVTKRHNRRPDIKSVHALRRLRLWWPARRRALCLSERS